MNNRTTLRLLLAGTVLMSVIIAPTSGQAQQPNITYKYDANFDYPLVPTDGMHTPPIVPLPAVLPGNFDNIYWNMAAINNGLAATPTGFQGRYSVDGIDRYAYAVVSVNAGESFFGANFGPHAIRGGRHTLEIRHDSSFAIAESDETDNNWAHQFIFSPLLLSDSTVVQRAAPPDPVGGWSSIVDGSIIDSNCDGFRFSSTGWWSVVTVRALGAGDDYDCYLYDPSTGSEDGFTGFLSTSVNGAGLLDAVVVNRNVMGIQDWDVGVENFVSGSSQFVIEKVVSSALSSTDSILVHFDTDDYLKIWDTYIFSADAGWMTVAVDPVSGTGPLMVCLYDPSLTTGGLSDYINIGFEDDQGRIRLHHEFDGESFYGLAVYRNPSESSGALDFTLEVEAAKPDLTPTLMPGWAAPLVPRPVADGTIGSVVAPDTLHGYSPDTYFNLAIWNPSPTPVDAVDVVWYNDGMDYWIWLLNPISLGPYGVLAYNGLAPAVVPGGRHTLTLQLDIDNVIDEIFEDNNTYGEQFCWSPMEIAAGDMHTKYYPPFYLGGSWSISTAEPFHNNCDGYRLPRGSGWWQGMVLNQSAADDYDLDLFHPLVGAKDGFASSIANSGWPAGQTDYVLVNNNLLMGVYDVGVMNATFGGQEYTVEAVTSQILTLEGINTFGPFFMPASHMLHLWDIWLEPDVYSFRLDNMAGTVNWGLSLHPADQSFQGRDDVLPDGTSWFNGAGQDEWITVNVPDFGWYCLAVFKTGPEDFPLEGEYRLRTGQGLSGVVAQDQVPTATALTGIYPNPFNPRTTIAFDLSVTGPVDLAVYDLTGALVRNLVRTEMPAGSYEVVWDGSDESGRRVASGVYMSRLLTDALSETWRVTLVK